MESTCSRPRVFAHVYQKVEPIPHKLRRQPAISDLRSGFFYHLSPDMDAFVFEGWKVEGQHTPDNTFPSPRMHIHELSAVSPGVELHTDHHAYELTAEPLETSKPLISVNANFSQLKPRRVNLPREHHPRTHTSRPRRQARLFNQAGKDLLRRVLPTVEEEPNEDKDLQADEIHGLASASSIFPVPSIVVSDHDTVLVGRLDSNISVGLRDGRYKYQNQLHRNSST